jgi:Delta3-Delta2-enoyl-CoA isomerase
MLVRTRVLTSNLATLCSRSSVPSTVKPALLHFNNVALMHSSAVAALKSLSEASEAVKTLKEAPGNEVKLKLYALFKQASVGPNTTPKPGMLDVVGKYKWTAWSDLGQMSKADAEKAYISLVSDLLKAQGGAASPAAPPREGLLTAADAPVLASDEGNGIRYITLNRPSKKNAITFNMYHQIVDQIEAADKDDAVKVIVLTGSPSSGFYTSGNDLSNFAEAATNPKKVADEGEATLKRFVGSFIHAKKPVIIGLNGPAVGIAVTTLPLADLVYASHKATLHAPLTALGQTTEGCASYTYPIIMGSAKANELLLLGKKITAEEAKSAYNLVNEVFEDGDFQAKLKEKAKEMASLPPQALTMSKNLIREKHRAALDKANAEECATIKGRWLSQECQQAIMKFMTRKG